MLHVAVPALIFIVLFCLYYFTIFQLLVGVFVLASILVMLQTAFHRVKTTAKFPSTTKHPNHLIVLQHGFLAPWIRMTPLFQSMTKFASKSHTVNSKNYLIHVIKSNSNDYVFGWVKTQDGIDKGGRRIYNEITSLTNKYPSINEISMIGGSLGGLYIRYAASLLYKNNQLTGSNGSDDNKSNKLIAKNLISLGSPHLGIDDWVPQQPALYPMAKYMQSSRILPRTLSQLLKLDNFKEYDKPLIEAMATEANFIKPLTMFENCMMYGNTMNDNRVSLSSALALPSFGEQNEASVVSDIFDKQISEATTNKTSIVAPCKDIHSIFSNYSQYIESYSKKDEKSDEMNVDFLEKYKDCWYKRFNTDVDWQRYLVVMNANLLETKLAHTLLASPVYHYNGCKPVLKHLNDNFRW